jgi:hypothetical protein
MLIPRVSGAALVKVTGTFQKSTEIMKASNALVKLPQLSATMREMSAEMMKVSFPGFFYDRVLAGLGMGAVCIYGREGDVGSGGSGQARQEDVSAMHSVS